MEEELRKRIHDLEQQLEQEKTRNKQVVREKIETMSSQVVDSNPYSRLMALKRMGIVNNYEVGINVILVELMLELLQQL